MKNTFFRLLKTRGLPKSFLSFFFSIFFIAFIALYSTSHAYVAKINKKEVSLKEFQSFVNFQKFIAKENNLDTLLKQKGISRKELLKDYINMLILLEESEKKNYASNAQAKKIFQETRQDWLISLFVNRNINLIEQTPSIAKLKEEYNKLPQARERKFEDLSNEEKKNLYQIRVMRDIQDKKAEYRKILEKKYKVKYNYTAKNTVAKIGKKTVSRDEVEKKLSKELEKLGIVYTELEAKNKAKAEQIKVDMIHEVVFRKLTLMEIKNSNFTKNKYVADGLRFYGYQVRIEEYIKGEIISNIPISSTELDNAFVVLSRENPRIQKMLPTEQEKILKSLIIQQKLPKAMNDLLIEKKEEAVIYRNYDELKEVL